MPERFIVEFREQVTDLLRSTCSVPVYGWLPDDVAHLPVIAVGRPGERESGTPTVGTMSLDITLLGRRIADEDSQAELDALADELWGALGYTRGVKIGATQPRLLTCHTFRPGTALVAGLDYPAYLFTVTIDISVC